jgi:beta-aspartyl-peptidase (threonine type)
MTRLHLSSALVFAMFGPLFAPPDARAQTAAKDEQAGFGAAHFVLAVHGGAGSYDLPAEQIEARRMAIIKAAKAGYDVLARGGTSVDSVEAALRVMEDSAQFDAGSGSVYTEEGVAELDAAIMDGQTLNAGAVAAVQRIANPIHLARLVMEKTHYVLLVARGAEEFAKAQGIELVSPYHFFTEREWTRYQKAKAAREKASRPAGESHGTTGVVALDQAGNLAAGTSTGGLRMKMAGRVGDSPIIGAGTYANNASCAVSATGTGEFFMRNIVAADICERVRYLHVSLEQAANDVVMKELVQQHGDGGVIALDKHGNLAMPFNTEAMLTATVRADGKITVKGWAKNVEPLVVPANR